MRKDGQRMTGNPTLDEQERTDRSECLALGQQSLTAAAPFLNCMDEKGYVIVPYYQAINVGKDNWLTGVVHFCQVPAMFTRCPPLAPPPVGDTHHIKVDGIERGSGTDIALHYCHVTLDDGRTGYIETGGLLAYATDVDPVKAAADCKRRGDPRIGMTAKQVEATCWGKPEHVNRTETAGAISDQYVYSNDRYVYLHNGIVTSIQASGTLR
jgi:hypothetical protein